MWCQRSSQDQFDDVDVLRMIFCFDNLSIDPEIQPVDISTFILIGKIKIGPAVLNVLVAVCGLIIFVCIRPQMEPDEVKRIG